MPVHKRVFLIGACALAASVALTSRADAQWNRGPRVAVGVGVYSPFVGPWYDPWWGAAQWGPYPYPYPYPYVHDPTASVRVEVKPDEAEVFVDGFYAGIVDDFDGVFQRLHVPPGDHDITLYLDGYRTTTQKVHLTRNHTFKIKYTMERLGAGEQQEPRPQPPAPPPGMQQPPNMPPPVVRRGMPPPLPPNAPPPTTAPGAATRADGYGSVTVRVQPADAEVVIDGQVWHGPADRDRLVVDVAEGHHALEIRKAGYRTYVTDIDVRRGEVTTLNVSLRGQDEN